MCASWPVAQDFSLNRNRGCPKAEKSGLRFEFEDSKKSHVRLIQEAQSVQPSCQAFRTDQHPLFRTRDDLVVDEAKFGIRGGPVGRRAGASAPGYLQIRRCGRGGGVEPASQPPNEESDRPLTVFVAHWGPPFCLYPPVSCAGALSGSGGVWRGTRAHAHMPQLQNSNAPQCTPGQCTQGSTDPLDSPHKHSRGHPEGPGRPPLPRPERRQALGRSRSSCSRPPSPVAAAGVLVPDRRDERVRNRPHGGHGQGHGRRRRGQPWHDRAMPDLRYACMARGLRAVQAPPPPPPPRSAWAARVRRFFESTLGPKPDPLSF